MEKKPIIGFIGLGTMGLPMARNLMNAGFPVDVWNRTMSHERAQSLLDERFVVCPYPAELARHVDIVITCLTDGPAVSSVLFAGQDAVVVGAKKKMLIIDMSTISPADTRFFAKKLKDLSEVDMLDAPVSGGDIGAREGTLSIMVGGKKDVFERALPVLRAMGKNVVHMGDHGKGQETKLLNQMLCAIHTAAVAELITMSRGLNLDTAKVLEVLAGGAAQSWALDHLGPKMVVGDLAPGFKMEHMVKDLGLLEEFFRELVWKGPLAREAQKLFLAAQASGRSSDGTQAVIRAYGLQKK